MKQLNKQKYICENCQTIFNGEMATIENNNALHCPVCGGSKVYDTLGEKGIHLVSETFSAQRQGEQIYQMFNEEISSYYSHNANSSWDEVLNKISHWRYLKDEQETVTYRSGYNHISDIKFVFKVYGWRVVLGVNSQNKVYIKELYQKNDINTILK